MARTDLVILEEDHARLSSLLLLLRQEANAKYVLLLDKSGQQVAAVGELGDVDATALASLAAGNVAATEGLAQLIGERDFSSLHHEGRNESLHINQVSERIVLLTVFDEKSSLGLVRLRVQQHTPKLAAVMQEVCDRTSTRKPVARPKQKVPEEAVPEISDADIDALFGQNG